MRISRVSPSSGLPGICSTNTLSIIDLDRSDYYITNIVKCRPPQNRDPLQTEQDACIDWLRMQTKLMQPKLIVCLGRIAAMRLIRKDFRISREHGQWEQRGGIGSLPCIIPPPPAGRREKAPDVRRRSSPWQYQLFKALPRNLRRQGHRAAPIIWIAKKCLTKQGRIWYK